MRYLDFLRRAHERLEPPTYLEIGVRHGDSLALARAPSVGIDPQPRLRVELPDTVTVIARASDEHFAAERPLAALEDRPVAMAFIDGMHLVEYALRDFMNVERHAAWTSVAIFDDLYPQEPVHASRHRRTRIWTGDVFKVADVLARERPDLICLPVDTNPTGLLLVLGLDPASRVLAKRYRRIVRRVVRPDPQDVPAATLERDGALDAQAVLDARFWDVLRGARESGTARDEGLRELRAAVRAELRRAGPLRALRRRFARA